MQKVEEKLARFQPSVSIQYEGTFFTVARAVAWINPYTFVEAEGIARRIHSDASNPIRGREIASGRAMKALQKKLLCHKNIHNLLMA